MLCPTIASPAFSYSFFCNFIGTWKRIHYWHIIMNSPWYGMKCLVQTVSVPTTTIGLDPLNNCIASDRGVRLAIGRSFTDCTPVKGTYKGSSEHTLEVSVTIDNGVVKEDAFITPVFTYQVHNPGVPAADNSYRPFMEIQQQQ